VTISGNGAVRVFYVAGSSLTLIHLTVSGGQASNGADGQWTGGAGTPEFTEVTCSVPAGQAVRAGLFIAQGLSH
jgi:hypothetical protein